MTSHLSYSTSSSAISGTMGSDISDMVSQVMKDVREESIPENHVRNFDAGPTDSGSSSASFYSAAQCSQENSLSSHQRSLRSQRSITSQFYGSAVEFDDNDNAKPNTIGIVVEPVVVDEEKFVTTTTSLSQNLQGVVDFFSQTLNNYWWSDDSNQSTKRKSSRIRDGSESVEEGSIGNIDYGYSEDVTALESAPSQRHLQVSDVESSDTESLNGRSLTLSPGSDAGSDAGSDSGSGSKDESQSSGSGSSSSSSNSSSSVRSRKRYPYCSQRRWCWILLLVCLLSGGTGAVLFLLLSNKQDAQRGGGGSNNVGNDQELVVQSMSQATELNAPSLAPSVLRPQSTYPVLESKEQNVLLRRTLQPTVSLPATVRPETKRPSIPPLQTSPPTALSIEKNVRLTLRIETNPPSIPVSGIKSPSGKTSKKSSCVDLDDTFVWNDMERECAWLESTLRYANIFRSVLCDNDGAASSICLRTCKKCNAID
jgi:hypothetical protein